MTPNDAQIDVLLRRYARPAQSDAATEHLDADQLNAFAEGALPLATRSRYVSHLADCDDCRKLATELTIAVGATAKAEVSASPETDSWWRKLTGLFASPVLRYAAFAVALVGVGGVTFFALRSQRESRFVAWNEPVAEKQVSAVRQADEQSPAASQKAQAFASPSGTVSQATPNSNFDLKQNESKALDNPAAPPKPEKEALASANNPVLAGKRAAEPATGESQPSFAPAPPGETQRTETKSREDRDQRGIAAASGPRKSEPTSDKFKMMDRSRAANVSKDRAVEADDKLRANNQQATNQNRATDSNAEAPKSTEGLAVNRAANERTADESGTAGARRAVLEKAPETRSVGGHKFRRQGNAWVDAKFKPSMSVTNISRGSDDFRALDSALRSMAEQLSGEVTVVSKGKAYRIR